MRMSSLASAAGARLKGPDGPVPGKFLADSRLVGPGDAFVAFRGTKQDGHDFIADAVGRGASLILCEDDANVPDSVPSIRLKDCFRDIPDLASKLLARSKDLEVIAITGSVGKTTTKEILRRCLATSFSVHSSEHSYNTLVGCALTILGMPETSEALILEMGANHPGEIVEMVRFFPPTIAVVTEVVPSHLEGFSSVEGILEAKCEILRSPRLKAFFYNGDNRLLGEKKAAFPPEVQTFAVGCEEGDFQMRSPEFLLDRGRPRLTFDFKYPGGACFVSSQFFGRHGAYAIGFALAVGFYLGGSRDRILAELETMSPLAGRGRIVVLPSGAILVDDAYNANPTSLRASLEEGARIPARRRFAVIGEMLELGASEVDYHRALLALFKPYDWVWLYGAIWARVAEEEPLPTNGELIQNAAALGEQLRSGLGKGDVLLVKGSHGNRLDRLVAFLEGEEQ